MFFTDIAVVLGAIIFIGAVAIELRRDRDKKMWVGREAKSKEQRAQSGKASVPLVSPESNPPVVTQEELKGPRKTA
jgi:hypothetical protein